MEQYIIVGIIVAASTAYILRKFVFKPKRSSDSPCPGCGKCGGGSKGCG